MALTFGIGNRDKLQKQERAMYQKYSLAVISQFTLASEAP